MVHTEWLRRAGRRRGGAQSAVVLALALLTTLLGQAPALAAPDAAHGGSELASVTLYASRTSLGMDGVAALAVVGRRADGRLADLRRASVTYTSSSPEVAAVTGAGCVAQVRAGTLTPGHATWKRQREIVAYSRVGYQGRRWVLPTDWRRVRAVDLYAIGLGGLTPLARGVRVQDGKLSLDLAAGAAVTIVPHGSGV